MLTSNVEHQNQCWHEATKIAIYNVEDYGKETTVLIMLDKELLLFFFERNGNVERWNIRNSRGGNLMGVLSIEITNISPLLSDFQLNTRRMISR